MPEPAWFRLFLLGFLAGVWLAASFLLAALASSFAGGLDRPVAFWAIFGYLQVTGLVLLRRLPRSKIPQALRKHPWS